MSDFMQNFLLNLCDVCLLHFLPPLPPPKIFKPVLLEICTHDTCLSYSIVSGLFLHRKGVLFYLTRFALQTFWLVTQHSKQKPTRDQLKLTAKLTVDYFIQVFVNSSLVREESKIPL